MAAHAGKHAQVSQPRDLRLIVEKDVKIPMRDGTILYADVLRPDSDGERVPAIMNTGVYQKDKPWIPPADLEEEANPYMTWETANPLWWCPRGYALVRVDSRGSGKSPGMSEPSSYQEGVDFYDAVEWIAKRPWCSGNIGTLGISYHAASQWRLANLQPPSLKAIMPWEGRADQYRDQGYHGGIFASGYFASWWISHVGNHLLGSPRSYNPEAFNNNMVWNYMRNDLDSEFWRMCSARWDKITVPMYSVGNWGGFSMHLRGNTEGYMLAASRHKKLRIHTGTHFHPFHSEEGRLDQLRWFDHWLKGLDTGIMDEPPVKLEIRTGGSEKPYAFRYENEWPIARTRWTKMYLKINRECSGNDEVIEGELTTSPPTQPQTITYPASAVTRAGIASGSAGATSHGHGHQSRTGVSFQTARMTEDLEITGPLALHLWVSSTSVDMDIFVTLRNIGPDGQDIWEVGQQGSRVPLTKGWLRASHRKLDAERTLPYRPYHAHNERWWLKPNEPVECVIEIWPTSIILKKGHRLRMDVQPRDGVGHEPYRHFHADYNSGAGNTLYAGSDTISYLLLPVIPAR